MRIGSWCNSSPMASCFRADSELMYPGGAPLQRCIWLSFSNPALAAAVMANHLPQALKREFPIFPLLCTPGRRAPPLAGTATLKALQPPPLAAISHAIVKPIMMIVVAHAMALNQV